MARVVPVWHVGARVARVVPVCHVWCLPVWHVWCLCGTCGACVASVVRVWQNGFSKSHLQSKRAPIILFVLCMCTVMCMSDVINVLYICFSFFLMLNTLH